jgi:hypothetical protein
MERTEANCQTGEIKVIQLTAEEIAALPIPVPPTYSELRAAAYPSFADQFDTIFHGGLDAWKAEIQAVKTQFPKGDK